MSNCLCASHGTYPGCLNHSGIRIRDLFRTSSSIALSGMTFWERRSVHRLASNRPSRPALASAFTIRMSRLSSPSASASTLLKAALPGAECSALAWILLSKYFAHLLSPFLVSSVGHSISRRSWSGRRICGGAVLQPRRRTSSSVRIFGPASRGNGVWLHDDRMASANTFAVSLSPNLMLWKASMASILGSAKISPCTSSWRMATYAVNNLFGENPLGHHAGRGDPPR